MCAFDIEAWSCYRLEDDKVVEHLGMNDAFTLGIQLGRSRPLAAEVAGGAGLQSSSSQSCPPPPPPFRWTSSSPSSSSSQSLPPWLES